MDIKVKSRKIIDKIMSILSEYDYINVLIVTFVILILSNISFYLGNGIGRFLYTLFH